MGGKLICMRLSWKNFWRGTAFARVMLPLQSACVALSVGCLCDLAFSGCLCDLPFLHSSYQLYGQVAVAPLERTSAIITRFELLFFYMLEGTTQKFHYPAPKVFSKMACKARKHCNSQRSRPFCCKFLCMMSAESAESISDSGGVNFY